MIYEIVDLNIKPDCQTEFQAAVEKASPYFKSAKGCLSFRLEHCIEEPTNYTLVVGWETVDDHMVTFRESEGFVSWRGLVSEFFTKPPQVKHINVVLDCF